MRISSSKSKFFGLLAGVCIILSFFTLGSSFVLRRFDPAHGNVNRSKVYQRTLVEGLRVSRHGCRGVDFVECGSCRVEKMRKGPLTFGGVNVLAIDDLKVVMPPKGDGWNPSTARSDGKHSAARDIARRLGVSDGFLKDNGLPLKFSGLRVKSLAVNRLHDYDSQPEKVFCAASGEAVRDGLSLSGCTVFVNNPDGEFVGKAMISRSGDGLRLSWRGGELDI